MAYFIVYVKRSEEELCIASSKESAELISRSLNSTEGEQYAILQLSSRVIGPDTVKLEIREKVHKELCSLPTMAGQVDKKHHGFFTSIFNIVSELYDSEELGNHYFEDKKNNVIYLDKHLMRVFASAIPSHLKFKEAIKCYLSSEYKIQF